MLLCKREILNELVLGNNQFMDVCLVEYNDVTKVM
jgi:hypothetical protein